MALAKRDLPAVLEIAPDRGQIALGVCRRQRWYRALAHDSEGTAVELATI